MRLTVAEIKAWGALEFCREDARLSIMRRSLASQSEKNEAVCNAWLAGNRVQVATHRWRRTHTSGNRWRGIFRMLRQVEAVRASWATGVASLVSESERRAALSAKRTHWEVPDGR